MRLHVAKVYTAVNVGYSDSYLWRHAIKGGSAYRCWYLLYSYVFVYCDSQLWPHASKMGNIGSWCKCCYCYYDSHFNCTHRQTPDISHTLVCNKIVDHHRCNHAMVSRLFLQLSLPNPLKPGVKSRMKMKLEHCLPALLRLHLHSRLNTWLQWIGQRQLQDETRNM